MHRGLVVVFGMVSLVWQVGAYAATDWNTKLLAEFQGLVPTSPIAALSTTPSATPLRRDLTILLAQARRHWDELSSDTQTLVTPWLQRPVGAADPQEAQWSFKNPEAVFDTPGGRFKIHYIDKAVYTTDANAADKSWVEGGVATALDDVANAEHGTLAYAVVPSDGIKGGDAKFDVYLTNLRPYGFFGYVSGDTATSDSTRPFGVASYMVLDNDFLGYGYTSALLPLEVTAAHEYFHAVQNGYSNQEDLAFMEQTATWMEDIVFPTIHDNYNYIGEPYEDTNGNGQYNKGVDGFTPSDDHNHNGQRDEGSLEWPEAPLDAFDTPPLVQYGRFLWPRYLGEKFGNSIVKTIWEKCGQIAGDNTFAAMEGALVANASSLTAAYQEYAVWGYDKSKYSDGANYPLVWVDRTVSGANLALSSVGSPSLSTWESNNWNAQLHLSTLYTQITSPIGTYDFRAIGAAAALTMLVDNSSGTLIRQDVTLTNGVGQWTAPVNAVKVIAVVSNVSSTTDGMIWSLLSSGLAASSAPQLDSIIMDVSGQQIPWHTDTITLHSALDVTLGFKIVTSDGNGRMPNIKITDNSTGGYYDPTAGKFIWTKPAKAGTYAVRLSAYSATDIADSQAGTIIVVIDGATASSSSSSHKKKFLGSMDLLMLLLLVGYGVSRRLSSNYH